MAGKPFDPTLKTLVEVGPADWPALIDLPPAPARVIDADVATVSGAADKVIHVEAAEPFLLHLEFQAGHDSADLPKLMQLRNDLLDQRHDLLVRSVAVILRPEADAKALTGRYERGFKGEEPYKVFRYRVVRVWRLPVERLLKGGLGTLPLAPISNVKEAELPGVIEKMKARLARRVASARAGELWAATGVLMGLRYPRELIDVLLQGVRTMEESTFYQGILEKGEVKGAIKQARRSLLLQGEVRFGLADAKIKAALDGIADAAELDALAVRMLTANNWHDLLGLPAPAPKRRRQS